jgi:signal transduction histidine kinase
MPVNVDLTQIPATVSVAPALLALLVIVVLLAVVVALRNIRYGRRMAAVERVKSDVLNLASHELRTPLTVVKGYLSMIQDGSLKPDTPEYHAAFAVVTSKVRQIDRLVEEILNAARLEQGRLALVLDEADLRDIVSDAFHALAPQARPHHQLRLELAPGPVRVRADRVRIESVVAHLLDNAMKYSPEGGDVLCTVARRDDEAVVSVHDSGVGIAENDLAKLFTRFGRVVTSENSHIYGTGLGLYLSREVARAHGGDLEVVSTPGEGSTFALALPLAVARGRAAGKRSPQRGVAMD